MRDRDVNPSYLEHPHNDKCNMTQVLESNYIDTNFFLFTKRIDFSEITFAFSIISYKKSGYDRPHPDIVF